MSFQVLNTADFPGSDAGPEEPEKCVGGLSSGREFWKPVLPTLALKLCKHEP